MPRPNTKVRLSHRFKTSSKQGYKCRKKLLNCMENQVKTQTRMSIWPKLLRPERPAKSPRGIHVAPVAGSIGSGKYVSSQGWQTNKKATPRTSSLYKSIKSCRTSFLQTHPRLRNVILQDLADTPTQNQDNYNVQNKHTKSTPTGASPF